MRKAGTTTTTAAAAPTSTSASQDFVFFIFLGMIAEGGLWMYCVWQQLATTHDAAFGILQGGVLIPTNMTPQELLAFLQTNMDRYNRISWLISLVTQAVLISALLPNPLRRNILYRIFVGASLILEVTTDMWYSVATSTTLGGAFLWIFNYGGGGWIVSLSYIILISGASVFFGLLATYHLKLLLRAMFQAG